MEITPSEVIVPQDQGRKFSDLLTSPTIKVTVGKSKIYYIHSGLLTAESDLFANSLKGDFKESKEKSIELEDEDPALFGFFVEYLYRESRILSQDPEHYSQLVTLARLYAMGERLQATAFQAYVSWRFCYCLDDDPVSDDSICKLLRIACTEITERTEEDVMRAHIFWYAGTKIKSLRKGDKFRQLLRDIPDVGTHLILWVHESKPSIPANPTTGKLPKFAPESEYDT